MSRLKKKWKRLASRLRTLTGSQTFLCDSCKLNYGEVCKRRERPNAIVCEDYVKKY